MGSMDLFEEKSGAYLGRSPSELWAAGCGIAPGGAMDQFALECGNALSVIRRMQMLWK